MHRPVVAGLLCVWAGLLGVPPVSVAAGGQAPDPTQEAPAPVRADRAAQDQRIESELQGVFERVDALRGVEVTVTAGVVRLAGTVVDVEAGRRAVVLAEGMAGVLFIDDRIQVSTSLDERLDPTWDRLREFGYGTLTKLPLLAVAMLIVALAVGLGALLSRWKGPAFLSVRNPFLQGLIRRLLQTMLVMASIVVALDLLQATTLVGAIAGTAGLAGLAIGFAFKDIAENYLAGMLLAVRQPFAKNDQIVVGSFEGKVVRLTARETILMTLDGNHVRLPNAMVFGSPMINYTRNPFRRFEFDLGVGTTDDLTLTRETCVATLHAMTGVLAEPAPEALVMALGDSTVTVRCLAWIDQRTTEYARVRGEAIRLVKMRLEAAGVSLPSPEYLVRLTREHAGGGPAPLSAGTEAPEAVQGDVSVDTAVDRQIEVERLTSGDADLLARDPAPESPS